jgi:hypothetical protein
VTTDFYYSGDPAASELDELRFLIQDTDPEDVLLTDSELTYMLDKYMPEYESTYYVAALACETLSAKFAREVSYSADGVSVQASELQAKYNDLALSLRDQYKSTRQAGGPDAGGILWDETFDPSIRPLMFATGMHDNYEAGQQEFGGTQPAPEPEVHNG